MKSLNRFLFLKIDNASLILFRILFGILIALECYGAILTGWVKKTLIEPQETFNFIGLDWLQPLPGYGMYFYFFGMGTLGICIALGYKYRFSIISFTCLWAGVYFMQKTSYNNHYYLLLLISGMMCFFPAHRNCSIDVKNDPSIKQIAMFNYIKWLIIMQLFIVYTYASAAKIYGDWLDFSILKLLMSSKGHYYLIGEVLQQPWVHKIMGIFGIVFDLLIIPALLYKPTRKIAFFAAIFFHLFNAIVFQIGIFPFLSLAFMVFFFEPKTIRKIFFKNSIGYTKKEIIMPSFKNLVYLLGGIYLAIQLFLPLRHHLIKDTVLWTEEGHRMSWRMMLRSRSATITFKVINKKTKKSKLINLNDYLTNKQRRRIGAYPDFIWQFAQRLKKEYLLKGEAISVYALNSKISINGKAYQEFIDPTIDLADTDWNYFWHNEWILPSKLEQ